DRYLTIFYLRGDSRDATFRPEKQSLRIRPKPATISKNPVSVRAAVRLPSFIADQQLLLQLWKNRLRLSIRLNNLGWLRIGFLPMPA
ncbi:hypothetical protein ACFLT7_08730, partial [candidate division KSB1 bacterium]